MYNGNTVGTTHNNRNNLLIVTHLTIEIAKNVIDVSNIT